MKMSLTKYQMLGLAIAAIISNVGFAAAYDPLFSAERGVLLSGLCVAATYAVYRAVEMVEAVVRRRSGN